MFVSQLLLALTLGLWALDVLFSLGVSVKTIAVLALATAVLIFLEGWGIVNWNLRQPRR